MDTKQEKSRPKFGLVGKNIDYSFSRAHFTAKFEKEQLPYAYVNFDIESIAEFPEILMQDDLRGLNVTIPYKEQVIPFIDKLHKTASEIGAVNTIKFLVSGQTKGYNTDYYGFKKSIAPFLKPHHKNALILGTGGASKAIAYALQKLGISFAYVSRTPHIKAKYIYTDLTDAIITSHTLIINCTPVGTHPNVNQCPDIPYDGITKDHLLFDLIYNPIQTKFLICGEIKGATTCNGAKMLEYQAEKAWQIWNK
ncbi:shikimate dehydrogenase [Gelidibacter salicanalis]|uniref:Shikimate dehydrogenase n=1 Tax=Gelidibacter salicanalis TaxID=291193 RepID=A0A5C7APA8_9FLAO|nr:shikimate dehydrogenase [Gelidibacter salicanalis]TXE09509.1 shikimate dehydrogenase [Gelidibacter salicanalis]